MSCSNEKRWYANTIRNIVISVMKIMIYTKMVVIRIWWNVGDGFYDWLKLCCLGFIDLVLIIQKFTYTALLSMRSYAYLMHNCQIDIDSRSSCIMCRLHSYIYLGLRLVPLKDQTLSNVYVTSNIITVRATWLSIQCALVNVLSIRIRIYVKYSYHVTKNS